MPALTLVAISDTHGHHASLDLPPGDMLVHAGDSCKAGTLEEFEDFLAWFSAQPHEHKVLIAGNHDRILELDPARARSAIPPEVAYLEDEAREIAGFRVYGSPWTPLFADWSFMLPRGQLLAERWSRIPDDTQILITHGPAYGHGDLAPPNTSRYPKHVGCLELLDALRRVRPQVHICGHIHQGYGVTISDEVPFTRFMNAATCTEAYRPDHAPLVIELYRDWVAPRPQG